MAINNEILYLQIQSKERDLDSLRTRNEALEAQIRETQDKYKKELEELQVNVDSCAPRVRTWPHLSHEHTQTNIHACKYKVTPFL